MIDLRGEAPRRLGEALWRDAMHGAEGVDYVLAVIAVMERRRDQVEALLWHFGVLDVQGESLGHALERKRYGNAAPADRDDEAWPGRRERLVGGNKIQQAPRRHVNLQARRREGMAPVTRTRFRL